MHTSVRVTIISSIIECTKKCMRKLEPSYIIGQDVKMLSAATAAVWLFLDS